MIVADSTTLDQIRQYQYSPDNYCMKRTSIIILSYNEIVCTQICIESVRKFTDNKFIEIIVVDNGSTDGTVEWLKKQNDLVCVYLDKNYGIASGFDRGYEIATGETVVFLPNDTIVMPNWLNNLNRALYSDDSIGGAVVSINAGLHYQVIPTNYNTVEEMIEFAKMNNISNPEKWEYRTLVALMCLAFKKSVLDIAGAFDERFSPAYYEDYDLALNVISNGYKILLCKDAFIHHFSAVTISKVKRANDIHEVNKMKFDEKWGFKSDLMENIRFDLLSFIDEDKNKSMKILEVDCGIGLSLVNIKNQYKNSILYGVEANKSKAKISRCYGNIINGKIDDIEINYEKESFDYIILGSTLEKVRDINQVLEKLKIYLKNDGYLLASFNNIMNIKNIKNIINGKYETKGRLLYTINDLYRILSLEGYNVEKMFYRYLEYDDEKEFLECLTKFTNKDIEYQLKAVKYYLKISKFN